MYQYAASTGIRKWSTRTDPNSATLTTLGITPMKSPMMPGTNSIGMNAQTVVTSAAITGIPTSSMPVFAARMGGSPRSMCRWMFSATMIAPSTTIPSTRMKLKMTMFEMGTPAANKKIRPTAVLKGIAVNTRTEIRTPRDTVRITSTSVAPTAALEPSTENITRMSLEMSRVVEKVMWGYCSRSWSTRSLMARAVPSVLMLASLLTITVAVSLPSNWATLIRRR